MEEQTEETVEEQTEGTVEEQKGIKAKDVSLAAKIVGGLVILVGFVLKCLNIFDCNTNDLIKVGFAIMAICCTVDINIMIDKFVKKE